MANHKPMEPGEKHSCVCQRPTPTRKTFTNSHIFGAGRTQSKITMILCYVSYQNLFIWYSPRENICHNMVRNVCLNYSFWTMCLPFEFISDIVWHFTWAMPIAEISLHCDMCQRQFMSLNLAILTTIVKLE